MTPTPMTIHALDRANCMQAALASLLDMPIDEAFDVTDPAIMIHWWEAFTDWCETRGLRAEAIEGLMASEFAPKGYSIAVGDVSRNRDFPHAVIALDGVPVFDPAGQSPMLDTINFWITVTEAESQAMAA